MAMKLVTALMLLTSSGALAQVFSTVDTVSLDLRGPREVARAQADVVVSLKTIEAPRGIRCGASGFATRVVTTLESDCEVRTAAGSPRWIRVTLDGGRLSVHVRAGAASESESEAARLVGEYEQTSVKINGQEAAAQFGVLQLLDDGRYRIGRAEGRWWLRGATLEFDGPIAHWIAGAEPAKAGLRFSFLRGPLEYEITYAPAHRDEERRAAR